MQDKAYLKSQYFYIIYRRFGMVDKRFCVEGGSRCGKGAGLFVFAAEGGRELTELLNIYSHEAHSRLSVASRSGSGEDCSLINFKSASVK